MANQQSSTSPNPFRVSRRGAKQVLGRVVIVATALHLGSCTAIDDRLHRLLGGFFHFEVVVDPNLNDDAPLAVDLVVFYDTSLFETARAFPASKWFEQRTQVEKDFGRKLHVHSWEWVPARPVKAQRIVYRPDARGGLVFARYSSQGDHRATVWPLRDFTLHLGKDDFTTSTRTQDRAARHKAKAEAHEKKKEAAKAAKEEKKKQKEEKKKAKESAGAEDSAPATDGPTAVSSAGIR